MENIETVIDQNGAFPHAPFLLRHAVQTKPRKFYINIIRKEKTSRPIPALIKYKAASENILSRQITLHYLAWWVVPVKLIANIKYF